MADSKSPDFFKRRSERESEEHEIIQKLDLIEMVRKKPALWDSSCKEYKSGNKMTIWSEICERLVPFFNTFDKSKKYNTVLRLIKKWNTLRDSYRKSRKKFMLRKTNKPYIYSDKLSFLNRVLKINGLNEEEFEETNYSNEEKSDTEEFMEEVYLESEENEINLTNDCKRTSEEVYINADDIDVTPAKVLKLGISENQQPSTSFTHDDNMIPIFTALIEREEDEDRAFFNSLMPTVKKLGAKEKLDFRIQVMNILKGFTVKKEKDPVDDDDDDD